MPGKFYYRAGDGVAGGGVKSNRGAAAPTKGTMKPVKPISKTAQMKIDRANRVAAKLAKKTAEAEHLAQLRLVAADAVKTLPADFGTWGIVRTRAYMKLVEIVAYRASLITVKADQLAPYIKQLQAVPTMPIDQCAELEQVNARLALGS